MLPSTWLDVFKYLASDWLHSESLTNGDNGRVIAVFVADVT